METGEDLNLRVESGAIKVRERGREDRKRGLFLLQHHQLCHATLSIYPPSLFLGFWNLKNVSLPISSFLPWLSLILAVRIRQWPTSLTWVVSSTSHLNKRPLPPPLLDLLSLSLGKSQTRTSLLETAGDWWAQIVWFKTLSPRAWA